LAAALAAYDQALERQPDLQAALRNKLLVEQLLDEQQRQAAPAEPAAQPGDAHARADTDPSAEEPPPADPAPSADSAQTSAARANPGDNRAGRESPGQPAPSQDNAAPASTQAFSSTAPTPLDGEQRQALEQWLRQIPDDPSELLKRKFWYEQQHSQDTPR
jgi:Ca-activated chloride channel family protein